MARYSSWKRVTLDVPLLLEANYLRSQLIESQNQSWILKELEGTTVQLYLLKANLFFASDF